MNPKSFPKRLDSKTSCLRITVPENLDLALEGLIRKVLREQPKTDDIYAFAANYFETLLKIRDKAGVEYTATQLCPFHNDEEAREMIVLAGTFPRRVPVRVQGKGPAPLKTETDKVEPEKGFKISEEKIKDSNSEVETKQTTPDLIKKLPLLAQNHDLNGEKTTHSGPDRERTETIKEGGDEEEYQTSDPIKEFVEKELLTERNSKGNRAEGKAPEPSEKGCSSPTTHEGKNEEVEGGAPLVSNSDEKKCVDGRDNSGATNVVVGVTHEGEEERKRKIDPDTRETDEKGVEAGEAEGKIGCVPQPEAEGQRHLQEKQQEKEKENEEWTSTPRAEEESENKMESARETVEEAEGVEAPLPPLPSSPGGAEKHPQEVVHEVSRTEADVSPELEGGKAAQTQRAASSEAASPKEKEIVELGGVQKSPEDKNEITAQPSTSPPMKIDEESPKTSSLVTSDSKPVENDGDRAAETDRSQKSDRIEENNGATESIAWSEGEAQDPITEAASRGTEGHTNNSETGSSFEWARGVQEVKEGGASFEEKDLQRKKEGESNEGRKNPDTRAEDPREPDLKSTEEGAKLTSVSAVEAEHAAGKSQMRTEDSVAEGVDEETEFSGKLDPGIQAGGSEMLKPEKFSNSHVMGFDEETESKSEDQEGKEGADKKLSHEEAKAKDRSLAERWESKDNRTSPQEEFPLQRAEDVQCAGEAPREESTDAKQEASREESTDAKQEASREESTDAKQEASRDESGPTGGAQRLREAGETETNLEICTGHETESAEPQEFKTEVAVTAENEAASLATEEPCSVVDINYLKRDGGNQEAPEPAKPRLENTAEEKSAPEPESSSSAALSPSAPNGETQRENRNDEPNFQRESEAEDATRGKAEPEEPPNASPVQVPVKSETDREKVDSSEGTPLVTWEGFDPSGQGKQIIIVEEPETTSENPEESSPPGEIQIKTIQTHYYDALRVPETVTREYRMHEVIVPTIDGLLGSSTSPPSTSDETRESAGDEERSGRLTDDNAVPPTPKTSPTSDGPAPSPYAEAAEAQPDVVETDSLLAVDGSDQASVSDDLPRPETSTSDVSSNLFEFSSRAASETFLTNEKHFSSLQKEEIRFVTPATEEAGKGEPEGREIESGRGFDEKGDERVLPFTAEDGPASRASGKTEAAVESTEGKEVATENGKRPSGSPSGGSTVLSDERAADGDCTIDSASEKPLSESRPQGEDESVPAASQSPSGTEAEHAEDFRQRTASRVESAKESFHSKTQESNVPESSPEEVRAGNPCDARPLDLRSIEWTPTGEASHAEMDSATSSATTEAKRTDSARRDLASARSLDLGKRNPLLRTRSLSAHRHGVADFEVWSTIEKELEEAATKIQSKFRGYKTRKKLRREVAVQISTEESSERSTPAEANDADNHPRATGEFHDGIVLAEHPR